MLGFIYIFTNPMFPENTLYIIDSYLEETQFIKQTNLNYIQPIKLLHKQPSNNILDTITRLDIKLKNYQISEHFYKITLLVIKKHLRNIILSYINKNNVYNLYINPNYQLIMH